MAEPARRNADGPRPEHPQATRLDPRKRIWADVRDAAIINGEAAGLAVTELAGRPDDDAALAMAELTRKAFEKAVEMAAQWVLDESVLEEVQARAYAAGYAACQAGRCRMQVIDGGRAPA